MPRPRRARSTRCRRAAPFAVAAVLSCALAPRAARAQLFGPPVTDAGEELDPQRQDGDPILAGVRPDTRGGPSACSFRLPVCVHGDASVAGDRVLAALASLERAWDTSVEALRLPPPDPGEPGAYRVYVVDRAGQPPSTTLLAARDVRSPLDRASAFSLVDRTLSGCALDTAIARELARATIFRVAPATDEATARAEASYLARLVVPCAMALPDGVDVFQALPSHALADARASDDPARADGYARGAALFFWWLDAGWGEEPGDLLRGLWSLSATATPEGALAWSAHPNGFDVLRTTFAGAFGERSTVDDLYVRFAVARAFMGSADDGAHLPETRALGDAALVALDWGARGGKEIAWPTAPRAFASPGGVAQTGAAYVLVHHDGAPAGAKLQLEAKWEAFTRMRWVAVKIDQAGKDVDEVPLVGLDRDKEARVLVENLDATKDLLVVGVALGNHGHRFDPADQVWEPHGWVLSIYPK